MKSCPGVCMPESEDPCSETRSCRASLYPTLSDDAKPLLDDRGEPFAYWNSLQTFSFVRWCSGLLRDVLASRTPFASFVRSSLYATRSDVKAPEKALFPLPFPKLGIFGPMPPRCSSRLRRKLVFDRAFHVFVAALNFLHTDCAFPPLDLLTRVPSSAQKAALWNLRCIFKAFGNSDEDFLVPKSGRRSTNLLAGLCDLSEFLTRSGAASDAYHHGFAGEACPNEDSNVVQPDLSRAAELVPYRQLDPSRIRLSGCANWDPAPYLCDGLLLPFCEPDVLLHGASFDLDDVPNLEKEDLSRTLELSKIWDVNGLLLIRPDVVEPSLRPACLRCFNCYKDEKQDRLIGDRRGRNQLEASIPGPSRSLPSGPALCVLEVPPGYTAVVCASDRKDFYHQIKVSACRARTNALWPPIPLSLLQSTKAYEVLMDDFAKRKQRSREEKGDDLGGLVLGASHSVHTKLPKKLPGSALVQACFSTVAQGDHLGVEFATDSHRNLLKHHGLLTHQEELLSSSPFAGTSCLQGLVIDDYFSVSIEKSGFRPRTSTSFARFSDASSVYSSSGLAGSVHKDVVEQQRAKIAGAEIDSSAENRANGVVTLGSPTQKRLSLSRVSLELSKLRFTTDALHACLIGGWTSALMFRRPLMSVLFNSHKLFDAAAMNSACPRVLPLPRSVAQELVLLAVLAPAFCSDISVPFGPKLFCTDSSDAKGAAVSTPISSEEARFLWRVGSKKGGYSRLLSKHEALLQRLSIDPEQVPLDDDYLDGFARPKKSPLLRYDFLEICGGASKVSRELSKLGWCVGPCLDLDSSPFFDLASLDLFRWVAHLLESSLLDGFLVQPPCTTFSPAQHPALRSYALPRGFQPTERRTLLGTCLALRGLGLMLVASRVRAIGMLEQSRRSKMAWLPEWRFLLDGGYAHEEWLASCMYGSVHQKEFRFLITNLDSAVLHRKCDGTHEHIKVEGKYTKASAVYTDDLATALARCISDGLRRKKACEAYHQTSDAGLESVAFNDFLVSSPWAVEDSWCWQRPAHINIHETAAVYRTLKRQAVKLPKQRLSLGIDSHVGLSALAKGRSPSYGLRPVLRRSACVCVAGCLYPSYHFAPTRLNPADCPTRDLCLPSPSKNGFVRSLDFHQLLKLSASSGLRRFLSNWSRLVLILLGGKLPWWGWKDSSRFGHYSKASYPAAFAVSCSQMDFDQTLGFPGEGPFRVWTILVLSLDLSFCSPLDFAVCCSFSVLLGPGWIFCPAAGAGCCAGSPETPHSGLFVVAMRCHGELEPRDRGDLRRATERKNLQLVEGRAVQPRTKDARDTHLRKLDEWLKLSGQSIAGLVDQSDLDFDRINAVLELYGRELFRSGRPYNHFAETLNALSSRRPRLRRNLQQAWNLAMTWLREEPGSHHVALPWQGLIAVITTAYLWGWIQVAGILALSWGGVTRIGEAVSAFRKDLLLPSDFGWTIGHILLQISEPKSRFKAARHQVARVDQPQLVKVVELAFRNFGKEDALWPHSGQTLRHRFNKLLAALSLSGSLPGAPRGLDLGSLRAGGATWLLTTSENAELVRRRGRWLNSRTMEIYIQETSALQFLPSLPQKTRKLLLDAITIFPLVLAKFSSLDDAGIPSNAWRLLLCG